MFWLAGGIRRMYLNGAGLVFRVECRECSSFIASLLQNLSFLQKDVANTKSVPYSKCLPCLCEVGTNG